MIQRYEFNYDYIYHCNCQMDEDDGGKWVRYEDYIKEKDSNVVNPLLGEVSSLTQKALLKWGKEFQIIVAIEELSELSQALCKSFRSDNHYDVIEEMADVIIMIEQLKLIYGNQKTLNERIEFKLNRLKERLEISS